MASLVGKYLAPASRRLVGEDRVDLGEVDFGEEGADLFDGRAGVAGLCGGFCHGLVPEGEGGSDRPERERYLASRRGRRWGHPCR